VKKIILGMLAMLVLGVAGAAWWLHSNLNGVVAHAITHYGSQMTQARVSVDAVEIRSTDGAGVVRGLHIGNPSGFRTPHALRVGLIEVAVDLRTVADPVVVVQRIVIDGPDVNYEKGHAATNFDAIQNNIAHALGSSSSTRKLIVNELVIRNATAHATAPLLGGKTVTAALPDVMLRNVGRAEGGITPTQLGQVVARAISQRLVARLGFERLLKSLGDRFKGLFGSD